MIVFKLSLLGHNNIFVCFWRLELWGCNDLLRALEGCGGVRVRAGAHRTPWVFMVVPGGHFGVFSGLTTLNMSAGANAFHSQALHFRCLLWCFFPSGLRHCPGRLPHIRQSCRSIPTSGGIHSWPRLQASADIHRWSPPDARRSFQKDLPAAASTRSLPQQLIHFATCSQPQCRDRSNQFFFREATGHCFTSRCFRQRLPKNIKETSTQQKMPCTGCSRV